MSCPQFEERLHDLAGGYLVGREKQEVDEHLLVCTACRDEVRAIRTLLEDLAALPRTLEAPPEIWEATRAEVRGSDRRATVITGRTRTGPRPLSALWPASLAAAAAAVLVSAGALWMTLSGPGPGDAVAPPGLPEGVAPATLTAPDMASTEEEFAQASEKLLAALEAEKEKIPPETLELIEENLRVINEAIAETRQAMDSDPGNAGLGRLMRVMYHRKMRLLQGAAVIPAG